MKHIIEAIQNLVEAAPVVDLNDAASIAYFRAFVNNVAVFACDDELNKLIVALDEAAAPVVRRAAPVVHNVVIQENLEDRAALIEMLEYLAAHANA